MDAATVAAVDSEVAALGSALAAHTQRPHADGVYGTEQEADARARSPNPLDTAMIAAALTERLPKGWEVQFSQTHKQFYFYYTVTGEVTWR